MQENTLDFIFEYFIALFRRYKVSTLQFKGWSLTVMTIQQGTSKAKQQSSAIDVALDLQTKILPWNIQYNYCRLN